MTELITEQAIYAMYAEELIRAQDITPACEWSHAPRNIKMTKCKGAYGTAHPNGDIEINVLFIGTDTWDKLRETMRHELAHLIAGRSACHNSQWRAAFARLGDMSDCGKVVLDRIKLKGLITFKWALIAYFTDGTQCVAGKFHKRNNSRVQYDIRYSSKRYSIDGRDVATFEYIENIEE